MALFYPHQPGFLRPHDLRPSPIPCRAFFSIAEIVVEARASQIRGLEVPFGMGIVQQRNNDNGILTKSLWVCLKIGCIPNYSHLIRIMISKTIGFRGLANIFRQTLIEH